MQVSITLYQTQRGKMFRLTPVCAGILGWTTLSRDPTKARERAIEKIRRETPKLSPTHFSRLVVPLGRRLERVRLELKVRESGDKKHVAGWFPLVVETRPASEEQDLRIAYHPLRPEAWFEIDDSVTLAEQAKRTFTRIFGPTDDFDALKSEGKDKLVTVRLDVQAPSLLALLEPKKSEELASAGHEARLEDLLRVSVNQTARAAEGRLRAGVPRDKLRRRLQQLLLGAKKTPVLVIGPPGSGKSTVIARAVIDLLEADDYPSHRNLDRVHNVLALRGRHLIAGMSYVGQWEARAMALLERAKKKKLILWSDDVHAWGSIGKTTVSERVLADFFRGPLARRELTVIGECTNEQLTLLEHEAPAFAATFARVMVEPASTEQTLAMLLHESRRLEDELEIAFDPRCFRRIVELGGALLGGSAFPGKALAPLEALAKSRAGKKPDESDDDDLGESEEKENLVTAKHVTELFSRQTGLPEILLSAEPPLERATLLRELGQQIMGQPAALEAACDLVLGIRAQTSPRGRPYGVFLFTGPTGTGKTELAKCIAEYLYGGAERLVRFDMGELNTSDAPSRLVGDRAEPEGQLTRAVRAQPFSVLLFDEIEKAHPAVLNLMLQIFDDGRLTDARGSVADFSHTVIVLTSNLGAGKRAVRGFAEDPKTVTADVARAVREFFPPELFNRIDRVVPFEPLGRAEAKDITKKELARLAARPGLSERNVFVRFTDAVVDEIVDQGYSAEYGARALKRHIDRAIGDLLTNALTSERRAEMRLLWLYHRENKLSVHAEALREAEPASATSFVETLLSENPSELRKRIPRALDALRALESDGRLETLGNDLTRALEGYRLGEGDRADLIFHLDTLRTHITHLTRRLESRITADTELQEIERRRKRQSGQELAGDDFTTLADAFGHERGHPNRGTRPPRRISVRVLRKDKHLLADLAEVAFLRQMVDHAGAADRHVALIDLVRLAAHHERRRFSGGSPGLLEWLASAYAGARGKLEASAVALADGTIRSASTVEGLEELLESRPRQVVLRVIGPGVTDFLSGETGCHVRRSAGTGPEIVRVRVHPGSRDLKAHLAEHNDARSAFEDALESARGLPENPEALLPVVRSIRFDPIPGRAAAASIEDYRFAHIATRRVRDLGELLSDFWLLAAGRSVKDVFE